MKAYRIRTGKLLELFEDPIGESPILNQPLEEYQQDIVAELGILLTDVRSADEIRDPMPYVVFTDDLFFTKGLLRAFLKDAEPGRKNAVLAVPKNGQWTTIAKLQDDATVRDDCVTYDTFRYVVPGDSAKPDPIVVDTDTGYLWGQRWPKGLLDVSISYHPVTDRYIVQLIVPLHVGMANIFARFDRLGRMMIDEWMGKVVRAVEWVIRMLGKTEQYEAWRLKRMRWRAEIGSTPLIYYFLRTRNKIGKDCSIHPSAILEGCDVGDNVRIGANCYLEHATVGDNVVMGEFCHLRMCAVGPGVHIPQIARISATTVYQDAFFATRSVNFGVIGREAELYFSLYSDYRLDGGPHHTLFHGKIVDSGLPFLGVIVGHRAKVAGGLVTAPGRFVPNGVTLLPPADNVFTKAPPGTKEGDVIRLGGKP